MNPISNRHTGFTLVELLVVMLILVAMASVTIETTSELAFQNRYEVTKDRYEKIKRAIIGRPDVLINGQPDISGFVADMGRLPLNIHDLLDINYCLTDKTITVAATCGIGWRTQTPPGTVSGLNHGWNGPYLNTSKNTADVNAFPDGWGNVATVVSDQDYGWTFDSTTTPTQLDLQSSGCGGNCGTAEYNNPYPSTVTAINEFDWKINISSGISLNITPPYTPNSPTPCDTSSVIETVCTSASWTWTPPCTTILPTSKNFCETNGGIWAFKTQLIKLVLTYRDSSASPTTTISTSTIVENGKTQSITFSGFPVSSIPMGTNKIFLQKGVNDIYPPACIGLNSADCTTATGVLLDNGICDEVSVTQCESVSGTVTRNETFLPFVPGMSNIAINW